MNSNLSCNKTQKTKSFELDEPLITFKSLSGESHFTVRQSCENTVIFGGTGSGKSSGSGAKLRHAFINQGYGGLVLCVKENEAQQWIKNIIAAGRKDDIVHVVPGGKEKFSFLNYESRTTRHGQPITTNLLDTIKVVIRASENQHSKGKGDDPFWSESLDTALINTINLCLLANGSLNVETLHNIFIGAPKISSVVTKDKFEKKQVVGEDFKKAFKVAQLNIDRQTFAWIDSLSIHDKERIKDPVILAREIDQRLPDAKILKQIDAFFFETYKMLAEKTRSIVDMSFSSFLFRLMQEPIYSLFSENECTFTPEDCYDGKIVILDIPVKIYERIGQDAQLLVKYIFQKAFEKRNIEENNRPSFIWCDEGHLIIHEKDQTFQTTCRDYRIAVVTISQFISNFRAAFGGQDSEHKVNSLLGSFSTKFFHCNSDIDTNEFGSSIIGSEYVEEISVSKTYGKDFSSTKSKGYVLDRIIRPEEFSYLKRGTKENNYIVEAIMHVDGRPFHDGRLHRKVAFLQQ